MQHEHSTDLIALIEAHKAMMARYEALYETEDNEAIDAQEALYQKLLESRKAILEHRPRTLDEVRIKAELMMGDRAFVWWDIDGTDVEEHFPEIIASLIPMAAEAEDQRDAA